MALNLLDRLSTIVVTATLTSAVWIVVGSTYVERADLAPVSTERGQPAAQAGLRTMAAPVEAELTGPLVIPVAGVTASQLSDTFTDARGGGERFHEALDIMAPAGTAVVAAAPGKVEKLFRSEQGGNTVYVRSPNRTTLYYYAHLQDYDSGLVEGQSVSQGQRLGAVGSTGNADPASPHLHFAIMRTAADAGWWQPARAINPYPLLILQK